MPASTTEDGRLTALLQEARGTDGRAISAFLSAAGFDDISQDGLIVLGAIAIGGEAAGDLMRTLGIPEQTASQMVDTLISRGYLRRRVNPGGRPATLNITRRAGEALGTATAGVRAARWTDFPFRKGDIVISALAKSGTTWVQMICALLVFQTPELPAPMPDLSPWLDEPDSSRDKVYAQLAGQRHRRFIKTHTPLSQIAIDPQVSYIVIARHPLDMEVSQYYQDGNLDLAALQPAKPAGPGPLPRGWAVPPRLPPRESLLKWIDTRLPHVMSRLSDDWTHRGDPNVMFLHYEDLSADLEGEMRQLAARLGFTVPGTKWPTLVKAATFAEMQAAAEWLAPADGLKSNAAFFRRGTSGAGRELLSEAELARYYACVARLAPPDLLDWLHRPGQ
jgi:aryl sulfotransferase